MQDPACPACKGVERKDDPYRICEMEVSVVRLSEDQTFLGYTFVTLKEHVKELFHLPSHPRVKFYEEMLEVANALDKTFHPDKMNYTVLGNVVPHLHWHLIPRYRTDPVWGRPPKFASASDLQPKHFSPEKYQNIIEQILQNMGI